MFSLEAIVYLTFTGDPLLSYHIQSGASRFQVFARAGVELFLGSPAHRLHRRRTARSPAARVSAGCGSDKSIRVFLLSLFRSGPVQPRPSSDLLLAGLAVGLFLYLEFGPLGFSVDSSNGEMHYRIVFKQLRFLLMLTAPLIVMAACLLVAIGRKQPVTALVLVVGLAATSLTAVAQSRDHYRSGLSDLRAAAAEV